MTRKIRIEFVLEDPLDDDEYEQLPESWDRLSNDERRSYLAEVEDSAVWRHVTAKASVVDEQDGDDRG